MSILYSPAAMERAMKIQEVILRAMSGELSWLQAADILRMRPRTLRRWRWRYEQTGYDGLLDRRRGIPSPRRAPMREVERIVRLYREKYSDFNVRHFHEVACEKHRVRLSYSFVKAALQGAGLVPKRKARGRHRLRREPKARFGEMLHLDGSPHAWLSLRPEQRQVLVQVLDDATGRVLDAQLWPSESTEAVMSALWQVFSTYGLPMSLYTDRAGWAFETPKKGAKVDPTQLTQVGRALHHLGVEHIPSYSPQARGRSERMNRTLQDRLVHELRAAGIRTVPAANRYIRKRFLSRFNVRFGRKPAERASAFVSVRSADLEKTLCHEQQRRVAPDNTVVLEGVRMQIPKQPGRPTCAGLHVLVRRHLNGMHSVWRGTQCLGRFDRRGLPLASPSPTLSRTQNLGSSVGIHPTSRAA